MTSQAKNYKISTALDSILLRNIPGFVIDKYNEKAIADIKKYMDREEGPLDINKSLILIGNPGCGKTELMKSILHCYRENNHPLKFKMKSVPDVASSYKYSGEEALMMFRKDHWLLDELGRREKEIATYYSNTVDIGDELIHIRYKLFLQGYITHMTSMYPKKELKEMYDPSTFSRLEQMANFVSIAGLDRRPTAVNKNILVVEEKVEMSPERLKSLEAGNIQYYIIDPFTKFLETNELRLTNTTFVYDKLEKYEILKLSIERKKEIHITAKDNVKRNNWSDSSFRQTWERGINDSIQSKIINECKRIAVIQFYNECKEMDINLVDLVNEKTNEPRKNTRVKKQNK